VVGERDLLAEKLNTDMEMMSEKVVKMKQDYELVIKGLTNSLSELRETNELKEDELSEATRALQVKEKLYADLSQNFTELQNQYNELKSEVNTEMEHRVRQGENGFMEKLGQMDQKLNEARREQAKAVVLMRQIERSSGREKERMEGLLKSCDEYYQEHIKKLQAKLISLEKEKNALASLLRQQQQGVTLDSNLVIQSNYASQYSPGSVLKSPAGFFDKNLIAQADWFGAEKRHHSAENSLLEVNKNTSDSQSAAAELTSFWLNSKHSVLQNESYRNTTRTNDDDERNEKELNSISNHNQPSLDDNETAATAEGNESSEKKNVEILQQIRKIMGDLQLSDAEDESDDNESEKSPAFRLKGLLYFQAAVILIRMKLQN
jgi:hypothetical protein